MERRPQPASNTKPGGSRGVSLKDRDAGRGSAEDNGAEPKVRRSQRGARSTSVESSGNEVATRGVHKRKKMSGQSRHKLAPPAEENDDRRRSAHSNISGTTARTSGSTHELADMNSEDMLDGIPDLYDLSSKILDFCAIDGIVPRLESDPRARKNLEKYRKTFDEVLSLFATERYINPAIALQGLLDTSRSEVITEGPWRPDDIFSKANLAVTVEGLMPRKSGSGEQSFPLEKLDRDFPDPFLTSFKQPTEALTTGSSTLLAETFEVGLEIRTQVIVQALSTIPRDSGFDAKQVVTQYFYEAEGGPLRGFNAAGLKSKDWDTSKTQSVRSRIEELQSLCSDDSKSVDIDKLRSKYPASKFAQKFAIWARRRSSEIDESLKYFSSGQGVGLGMQAALDNEKVRVKALAEGKDPSENGYIEMNYQPSSDPPLSESTVSTTGSKIIPKRSKTSYKFNSPQSLKHFTAKMAMAKTKTAGQQRGGGSADEFKAPISHSAPTKSSGLRMAQQAEPSSSQSTKPQSAQNFASEIPLSSDNVNEAELDMGLTPFDDQEEDTVHVAPTKIPSMEDRKAMIELERKNAADANKENDPTLAIRPGQKRSLFDRHEDAEQLQFDSQPYTHTDTSSYSNGDVEQSSNVSENGGFEEDTRTPPPASRTSRQKRAATRTEPASSPKRVRILQPESSATRTPPRSILPWTTPQSSSQIYQKVNRYAKGLTGRTAAAKPAQTRRAWSQDETDCLIESIETCGTSWALIKQEDNGSNGNGPKRLTSRDQVALKDKARNMKFDYLKAGVPLPTNFEYIALKRAQRDKLREFGVQLTDYDVD